VRVTTLRRLVADARAELLLTLRRARSRDFEDERLQLTELALPFLRVRGADTVEREEELAQESQ
jgi:hypothetical protein